MGAIFQRFEKYSEVLTPDSLVLEIGTDRGLKRAEYAGSTRYMKELADKYSCSFATVDVDNELLLPAIERGVDSYAMTGEAFCQNVLPDMNKKVSMVYLDNFDWDWNPPQNDPFIKEQQELYRTKYNMVMNNVSSQRAHVLQTMFLLPYLAEH